MLTNLVTSVLAFAATNIDDIFILMLFFGNRNVKKSDIFIGQYLGIGALVLISVIGAFVGNFVDQRYIGLLGLFPIYLAIKHTVDLIINKAGEHQEARVEGKNTGSLAIAGVTIANGADNLGVYIPLLTTMDYFEKIQLLIVFAFMVYLWCVIAKYLASRPLIARQLNKYGHIIMPVVLFALGIFIILDSGSLSLISHR